MTEKKSLKKGALFNSIRSVMNIIFPVISFPYASRVLMPDGIGAVNFANSIIEYFVLFANLGITTYAAREAARVRNDKYALTKFTREILSFNCITTVLSYLIFVICLFFVPKFSAYRILLIVCSTKVLFYTLGIEWFFTAHEEYSYITLRHTLFQLISLILLFTLVKTKDDYLIYAGIGVFSNVGANVFNFFYARRHVNIFTKTPIQIKSHIKPVLTFFSVDAAGKINGVLDTIMLGFLAGNVSVGLYIAATKLSQIVRQFITSIISTFMPRTSYLVKNNETKEYSELLSKVFDITFFFSFPAAAGLFILAKPLTVIFCGNEYIDAVPTMQLLSLCIIFMSFNSYLNNLILTPNKLERFMLYAQLTALFFNAGFNWLLITHGLKYGLTWAVFGAGIATFLVDLTLPVVKLIAGWKFIKNNCNFINVIKTASGTLLMAFVLLVEIKHIASAYMQLIVCVSSGVLVYIVSQLLLRHPSAFILKDAIIMKVLKKIGYKR